MYSIFTPYRVCPLGAHVDHQMGLVTGFAIDRGVKLSFEKTDDGTIHVQSKNFSGIVSFNIHDIPDRQMTWGDFVQGAVKTLAKKYNLRYGFTGVVEGTLPVGGLSSSAAVIITYINALCYVNEIQLTQQELINAAIWEERNYIGVNVGKLDQCCEVYCKKDNLLFLDTSDDSCELIPINKNMPDFDIMIIFSGVERKLAGSAYNTRVDECKSAAYALKAFSGMEYGRYLDTYLRDVPYGIFTEYKDKLPHNWVKRAEHFYAENKRVEDGVKAWRVGDLNAFGQLMFESGTSSIEKYETGSKELICIHHIMEQLDGVYGSRFSGAGFNGSSIALIDPLKKDRIIEQVTQLYLKEFPEYEHSFSIHVCKTADGVKLQ